MRKGETESIDKWLLQLSKQEGKTQVNTLFIPTASEDLDLYIEDFETKYKCYGADVKSLKMYKSDISQEQVNEHFDWADLIYIGGGDALILMEAVEKYNINNLLIKHLEKGKYIAGLSAGASILGSYYLNYYFDRVKFYDFSIKKGLGLVDSLVWCHFDDEFLANEDVIEVFKNDNSTYQLLCIGDAIAVYLDNNLIKKFESFEYSKEKYLKVGKVANGIFDLEDL